MKKGFVFPLFLIILTTSCSLKYAETVVVDDKIPEFLFKDATMVRYDNSDVAVELKASELEQYRNSSESYGKDIQFVSYDNKEIDTEGSCGYVFSNSDLELYELYDDIQLDNHKEKLRVTAEALKWNGKTEQLTSGRGDRVIIEKEDTTLRGTGFAASGVSKIFSFSGNVIGNVETKDPNSAETSSANTDNNIENKEIK